MKLEVESYVAQTERHWPTSGRVILAQFDEQSVVVYQAYRPSIGHFAAENQYFGGEFSLSRMSWIKPNFLWMMYRSDWGQSEGQEVVLAVRIHRRAFDEILRGAVHSSFASSAYPDQAAWARAVQSSDVRLQWDPDHGPSGRSSSEERFSSAFEGRLSPATLEWIIAIEDVSDFVAEQRGHVVSGAIDRLRTPKERVCPVHEASTADLLQLDHGRSVSAD